MPTASLTAWCCWGSLSCHVEVQRLLEMAESSKSDGRFPPEIVCSDDDPSKGYFSITMTIPGMKTKKGIFDKVATVTNGECKVDITPDEMSVSATIETDGKKTVFSYSKKLPEKISDMRSKYKLKNDTVTLILSKAEKVSWGQHATYFIKRP